MFNSVVFVDDAEALAIWSSMQRVDERRRLEVEKLERLSEIIFAEPGSDEEKDLNNNNANSLLVSGAKIVARAHLKENPLKLLRILQHQKTEALMQSLANYDKYRYRAIKELIQPRDDIRSAYFDLFSADNKPDLPPELLLNDMVAMAFEFIVLLSDQAKLMTRKELTLQESRFLETIEPIIKARGDYFSEVFWNTNAREVTIRTALANGLLISQIATIEDTYIPAARPGIIIREDALPVTAGPASTIYEELPASPTNIQSPSGANYRILKVASGIGIFTAIVLGSDLLAKSLTGVSLFDRYIEAYKYSPFWVAGLTASLEGAAAELVGYYLARGEKNKVRIWISAIRFVGVFLFRLTILGTTASLIDRFIDFILPLSSGATNRTLISRAALSLVHGVFLSSAVNFMAPYFSFQAEARSREKEMRFEEASELRAEYSAAKQFKRTLDSVRYRLAPVIIQHDIIQNIFGYELAFKILSRFALGFANSLFRSYITNKTGKVKIGTGTMWFTVAVSVISFIWGTPSLAICAVALEGAILLWPKIFMAKPFARYRQKYGVILQESEDAPGPRPLRRETTQSSMTTNAYVWRNPEARRTYSYAFNRMIERIAKGLHKYGIVHITPLIPMRRLSAKTAKDVYLKDESIQVGGSFKIRGVAANIDEAVREWLETVRRDPARRGEPFYLVTQTDGNHGAATILGASLIIDKYKKIYSHLGDMLDRIEPVVFGIDGMPGIKKNVALASLAEYRKTVGSDTRGRLELDYPNYAAARGKREAFVAQHPKNARYIEHGGMTTMAGHGSAGIEIDEELRRMGIGDDKKVVVLVPVGAGGPIGIGAALKLKRKNAKAVFVQTKTYASMVRSCNAGRILANSDAPLPTAYIPTSDGGRKGIVFEDGIAVDVPEESAFDVARAVFDAGLAVDPQRNLNECAPLMWRDIADVNGAERAVVGGTTSATGEALLEYYDTLPELKEADVVVLFGAEGNIDPDIAAYIEGVADGSITVFGATPDTPHADHPMDEPNATPAGIFKNRQGLPPQNTWQENIRAYLRSMHNRAADIERAVNGLAGSMPVMLEFACGNAAVAAEIARKNPERLVIATDLFDIHSEAHYSEWAKQWEKGELPVQLECPENLIIMRAAAGILNIVPPGRIRYLLIQNVDSDTLMRGIEAVGTNMSAMADDCEIYVQPFSKDIEVPATSEFSSGSINFIPQPDAIVMGVDITYFASWLSLAPVYKGKIIRNSDAPLPPLPGKASHLIPDFKGGIGPLAKRLIHTFLARPDDRSDAAGEVIQVPHLVLNRIVTLTERGYAQYQGIILQADGKDIYVLAVGHDASPNLHVTGYFGKNRMNGNIIDFRDDDEGRDICLIKMHCESSANIKFEPISIGYPPADGEFAANVAFVDYESNGLDSKNADEHKRIVTVPAEVSRYKNEKVNTLELHSQDGIAIDFPGICGAPVFRRRKLIGIINASATEGERRSFAITGNTILAFLRQTEYKKFLKVKQPIVSRDGSKTSRSPLPGKASHLILGFGIIIDWLVRTFLAPPDEIETAKRYIESIERLPENVFKKYPFLSRSPEKVVSDITGALSVLVPHLNKKIESYEPGIREFRGRRILRFQFPFVGNFYAIEYHDADGRPRYVFIDFGQPLFFEKIVAMLGRYGIRPGDNIDAVLVTHSHIDHIGGALRLASEYGVPLYMHPGTEKVMEENENSAFLTILAPKFLHYDMPQFKRLRREGLIHYFRKDAARPPPNKSRKVSGAYPEKLEVMDEFTLPDGLKIEALECLPIDESITTRRLTHSPDQLIFYIENDEESIPAIFGGDVVPRTGPAYGLSPKMKDLTYQIWKYYLEVIPLRATLNLQDSDTRQYLRDAYAAVIEPGHGESYATSALRWIRNYDDFEEYITANLTGKLGIRRKIPGIIREIIGSIKTPRPEVKSRFVESDATRSRDYPPKEAKRRLRIFLKRWEESVGYGIEFDFSAAGLAEDIKARLGEIIMQSNLVPRSFSRIYHGDPAVVNISAKDIQKVVLTPYGGGGYRDVFIADFYLAKGLKRHFIFKISRDEEGVLHQAISTIIDDPNEMLAIGGIWSLGERHSLLVEKFYEDGTFDEHLREYWENKRDIESIEHEVELVVKSAVSFWKHTGGWFIQDPRRDQFVADENHAALVDSGGAIRDERITLYPAINGDGTAVIKNASGNILLPYQWARRVGPKDVIDRLIMTLELRVKSEREYVTKALARTLNPVELQKMMPEIERIYPALRPQLRELDIGNIDDWHVPRSAIVKGVIAALGEADGRRFLDESALVDPELELVYNAHKEFMYAEEKPVSMSAAIPAHWKTGWGLPSREDIELAEAIERQWEGPVNGRNYSDFMRGQVFYKNSVPSYRLFRAFFFKNPDYAGILLGSFKAGMHIYGMTLYTTEDDIDLLASYLDHAVRVLRKRPPSIIIDGKRRVGKQYKFSLGSAFVPAFREDRDKMVEILGRVAPETLAYLVAKFRLDFIRDKKPAPDEELLLKGMLSKVGDGNLKEALKILKQTNPDVYAWLEARLGKAPAPSASGPQAGQEWQTVSGVRTVNDIAMALAGIVASNDYLPEQITLDRLFEYVRSNKPEWLVRGRTKEQKMALFCLSIWNNSSRSFSDYVRSDLKMAQFRGEISDDIYKSKLRLAEQLSDSAPEELKRLKHVFLPEGNYSAFAVAQYFRYGYEDIDKFGFGNEKAKTAKEFFELCLFPAKRKFVGQWERDYAQRLSGMSARELQSEWERAGALGGHSNNPIYLFSVLEFCGDTLQYVHPLHYYVLDNLVLAGRLDYPAATKVLLCNIAKMDIYLEWVARHWDAEPLPGIRSIPKRITPSLDYVGANLFPVRKGNKEIAFEERPVYKILTGITDKEAADILGLSSEALLEAISKSVNEVMKRGQAAIIDKSELRNRLEPALMELLPRINAKVKIDYDHITQVGYILYIPLAVNGAELFARYFFAENSPEDNASFLYARSIGDLTGQLLTKRSVIAATLSRSKHKEIFRQRTLPYLKEAGKDEHVYLASGDIDFLKKINNIYGECIVNAILAEIHMAIRNRLDDIERDYGLKNRIRLVFGGDEFIISFPPNVFDSARITELLDSVREAAKAATHRRFGVCAVEDFDKELALLPSAKQQELLDRVEEVAVTFNLKARKEGNIFLFRLSDPDDTEKGLAEFTKKLNAVLTRFGLKPAKTSFNWLKNGSRFKDGRMWTPTVSIGIVDAEDVAGELYPGKHLEGLADEEIGNLYNELLHRAEDALQVAKRARDMVVYGLHPKRIHTPAKVDLDMVTNGAFLKAGPDARIPEDERDNRDGRLMIDSAFRREVYESIKRKERAKLIQIDPVYKGKKLDELAMRMTAAERKALRGTEEGVGLRAINDLMGHEVGDLVICLLCDSIVTNLPKGWHLDTSPPRGPPVLLSRFVDKVRIYVRKDDGDLPTDMEIEELVRNSRETFNRTMKDIEVSQLTAVVIETKDFDVPGVAFEKLDALSALKDRIDAHLVKNYTPQLEPLMREYDEDLAFENARELNEYIRTAGERRTALAATERNINDYLALNFGSPEFAAEWDRIFIGSSNDMFYELSKDVLDPESPSVLDLGTGTGKALLPIAARFGDGLLVGADSSEEMLAFARGKYARQFPALARAFAFADVNSMHDKIPQELTNFDAVFARFLFNFIDLDVVLPQVLERLRPGGRVVFNVFAGFFWGYTDEFRRNNPFEEARIKVAKQVLEERVIPILTREQKEKLIAEGQIRKLPGGGWEILADPVTQKEKKDLDAASLEKALRLAGFEDIKIEPVSEMYPAEEKERSFLLTKSIPYFWSITNLIKDNNELKIRLVQEIWERMPQEFREGEHTFTDIFVSARRPSKAVRPNEKPLPKPHTAFLASTARTLLHNPKEISRERLKLFFELLTANPETFLDFYNRGLITFKETPLDDVYRDYGREVNMPLTRKNMYAFLEPILKFIIREKPDEIVLIDYGARPFEKPLRRFLKESGLDTPIRFIHVSAQTGGHDFVDVYKILKDQNADFNGKHVMVIDDNVVRLKTGPSIDLALRGLGASRVSYTAVVVFNRRAARFVDLATVRLAGNDMWISPERGFLSWTEWEEDPKLVGDEKFEREVMENFERELAAHHDSFAKTDAVINPKPVRDPLSRDVAMLLNFLADKTRLEKDFIKSVREGRIVFDDVLIPHIINDYADGKMAGNLGLREAPMEVKARSSDKVTALTLIPGIDLRFLLRQYISYGREGAEALANPEIGSYRIIENGEEKGYIRLARLYDAKGGIHLLLDRIDPDFALDVSADDLVKKISNIAMALARDNGHKDVLISGRDITFSKLGAVRDIFNKKFKGLEPFEGALGLNDSRGKLILVSISDHENGVARVKVLPADSSQNQGEDAFRLYRGEYDKAYDEFCSSPRYADRRIVDRDAFYEKAIRLVNERKKSHSPLVVAIDGPSGAFKTTVASFLASVIRRAGGKAVVISRDWFIESRDVRYRRQDRELARHDTSVRDNELSLRMEKFEKEVFARIETFKQDSAKQECILDLRDLYDKYGGGGLTHHEKIMIDRDTVIIIEGNFLLTPRWRSYYDLALFMLARPSVGIKRRLPRDSHSSDKRVEEIFWRFNTPSFIHYLTHDLQEPDIVALTDDWTPSAMGSQAGEESEESMVDSRGSIVDSIPNPDLSPLDLTPLTDAGSQAPASDPSIAAGTGAISIPQTVQSSHKEDHHDAHDEIDEHGSGMYHTHIHTGNMKKLGSIFAITFCFAWVELASGLTTGSVALTADAWHIFTDSMGIGAALFALWANTWSRPPPKRYEGHTIYEVGSAFLNGIAVIMASANIGYEGISHFFCYSAPNLSYEVFLVASLGLLVNIVSILLIYSSKDHDLNLNGAYRQISSNTASSFAAMLSGIFIWTFGTYKIDSILGLGIGVWIFYGAAGLVYKSIHAIKYRQYEPEHFNVNDNAKFSAQKDRATSRSGTTFNNAISEQGVPPRRTIPPEASGQRSVAEYLTMICAADSEEVLKKISDDAAIEIGMGKITAEGFAETLVELARSDSRIAEKAYKIAGSLPLPHKEKIKFFFVNSLLEWSKQTEEAKEAFSVQPVWNVDDAMLGKVDEKGEIVSLTPEVATLLDIVQHYPVDIFMESVRRRTNIVRMSPGWQFLRKLRCVDGFVISKEASREFAALSDESKRSITNIYEEYAKVALPMLYEADLLSWDNPRPDGIDRYGDLFDNSFFGKAAGMLFYFCTEGSEAGDEIKAIDRKIAVEVFAILRMAAALSAVKKGNGAHAIALYRAAIEKVPYFASKIARDLYDLAISEKGNIEVKPGVTITDAAYSVASALSEEGVAAEFDRIRTDESVISSEAALQGSSNGTFRETAKFDNGSDTEIKVLVKVERLRKKIGLIGKKKLSLEERIRLLEGILIYNPLESNAIYSERFKNELLRELAAKLNSRPGLDALRVMLNQAVQSGSGQGLTEAINDKYRRLGMDVLYIMERIEYTNGTRPLAIKHLTEVRETASDGIGQDIDMLLGKLNNVSSVPGPSEKILAGEPEAIPGQAFSQDPETLIKELQEERVKVDEIHATWRPAITEFASARIPNGDPMYRKAVRFGMWACRFGFPIRTGAGPSMMEAPLRGFIAERETAKGAATDKTQGIRITLPFEQKTSPFVEDNYTFKHFVMRKLGLYDNSLGIAVYPGGFGTLDELFESWLKGLPIVLIGRDYWAPIIKALYASWGKIGHTEDEIPPPQITDSEKEAALYIRDRHFKPIKPDARMTLEANKEIGETIRALSQWPASVTCIGVPAKDSREAREAKKVFSHLIDQGIPVRAGNRGVIFDDLFEVAARHGRMDMMQASLFLEPGSAPTENEKLLQKSIHSHDISNHHVILTENSRAFVFLPGGIHTMNRLFDIIAVMQTKKMPARPIILIGREFWQPIKDAMTNAMLSYSPPLINPVDAELLQIVDTAEEALAALGVDLDGAALNVSSPDAPSHEASKTPAGAEAAANTTTVPQGGEGSPVENVAQGDGRGKGDEGRLMKTPVRTPLSLESGTGTSSDSQTVQELQKFILEGDVRIKSVERLAAQNFAALLDMDMSDAGVKFASLVHPQISVLDSHDPHNVRWYEAPVVILIYFQDKGYADEGKFMLLNDNAEAIGCGTLSMFRDETLFRFQIFQKFRKLGMADAALKVILYALYREAGENKMAEFTFNHYHMNEEFGDPRSVLPNFLLKRGFVEVNAGDGFYDYVFNMGARNDGVAQVNKTPETRSQVDEPELANGSDQESFLLSMCQKSKDAIFQQNGVAATDDEKMRLIKIAAHFNLPVNADDVNTDTIAHRFSLNTFVNALLILSRAESTASKTETALPHIGQVIGEITDHRFLHDLGHIISLEDIYDALSDNYDSSKLISIGVSIKKYRRIISGFIQVLDERKWCFTLDIKVLTALLADLRSLLSEVMRSEEEMIAYERSIIAASGGIKGAKIGITALNKLRAETAICIMRIVDIEKRAVTGISDSTVDINGTLRDLARLYHDDDIVSISLKLDESLLRIPARPRDLSYLWSNILSNAFDAIHEAHTKGLIDKGAISISTKLCTDNGRKFVEIVFTDNGIGMTEETSTHIRAGDTKLTTKGSGGSGKGMPFVRKIIKSYGGALRIESTEGKGSTFTLRLPVVPEPSSGQALRFPLAPNPSSGQTLRLPLAPDPSSGQAIRLPIAKVLADQTPPAPSATGLQAREGSPVENVAQGEGRGKREEGRLMKTPAGTTFPAKPFFSDEAGPRPGSIEYSWRGNTGTGTVTSSDSHPVQGVEIASSRPFLNDISDKRKGGARNDGATINDERLTIDEKYAAALTESSKIAEDYGRKGQSLILYADDILASTATFDFESAVKNILGRYNILAGGKVIIFARDEANGLLLEKMIKRADPAIATEMVTQKELLDLKPESGKGTARETSALIEFAKRKDAKDLLALIRGPVEPKDIDELAGVCSSAKVPVVQVGLENAFYSFAEAIAMAIAAKKTGGANGWLIILPPLRQITTEMQKCYEEYRLRFEASVAA